MLLRENILISVDYKYVVQMLGGKKTAELRRRRLRIHPGARIWIYSKLPRGHVELVAIADDVIAACPQKLRSLYRERIGITYSEFRTYLQGSDVGCVLLLRDIIPLQPTLTLDVVRSTSRNFQPPQFFKRLVPHCPELIKFAASCFPV